MIAYVLSTGDEVLLGDIVDTNAAYLCNAAKEMGISVLKIVAVGDRQADIVEIISEAAGNADFCFVTGGLGPTSDDITALCCAIAAGDTLALHEEAYAGMQKFFASKGFEVNEENRKQALLPTRSTAIENDAGTAPGFRMQIEKCRFYFMPGVPGEMRRMFDKQIRPHIAELMNIGTQIQVRRMTVFGLPESTVGKRLQGFETDFPDLKLGFRAAFPLIEVKIMPHPKNQTPDPENLFSSACQWIRDRLEYKIVSDTGKTLEAEVGALLAAQKKTLSVAESCTGGMISSMVTDVAGSSDYFLCSAVTYSNEAKMKILGVQEKTLIENGAVHETTAKEMAEGARRLCGADFAIATTGIAGPGGGSEEKPVGTVCIGVAGEGFSDAARYRFYFDDREKNKKIFAVMALELLRRKLDPL